MKHIFPNFSEAEKFDYAPGVSSSHGAKLIGERISFGLATKAKGTGSHAQAFD